MTRYHKPSRASGRQIDEIRAMRDAGLSCGKIAEQLNFTERAVRTICSWNSIPSNYKPEANVIFEEDSYPDRLRASVDLHVEDIKKAHGSDKRWANHSIRKVAPRHIPTYYSNRLSVVGSPASYCEEM